MEVLRTIALYGESNELGFMVIGGHAVNHYGMSRQTGDIDFVVRGNQKDDWDTLLTRLRYTTSQNDERFARYRPASLGEWPIDLMFVDDQTFEKLKTSSELGTIGVAEVSIVSARHLATMKIHALKYYQEHRFAKDYQDLFGLLRSGKTDLADDELLELCKKYASEDLYQRLLSDGLKL